VQVTPPISYVGRLTCGLKSISSTSGAVTVWSKVKTILCSLKPRTLEELLDALVEAFSSVTMQDILGWFRHCG
jgi:hypothetical protein